MCLAIPVQIKEIIDENTAVAEISGLKKTISTAFSRTSRSRLRHPAWSVCPAKIDPEEAQKTLALFASEAPAAGEPA